ncbi:DUF4012 domain-containing protein [Rhodococcus ruber]|uniref:DUF4012 domain-containing protein n=1 Tax=Rhodococcus ruber TaxID=1830 RepID=UPI0011209D9F|nr:DUF4012 domain-containing protein [Rhodococcus ruber]QDC17234.1 DUF4012 domain-containing protein [Rhodococcus ruber]
MRRRKTDEQIAQERRRRRNIAIGCTAGAVVVGGMGVWLAYEGLQAKSSLEQAREYATSSKNALLAGDTETALRTAGDADKYAKQAQDSTHSLPWSIAAAIPWLGSPFASSQQMSDIVTGLTSEVLVPAVDAGSAVSPDQLILDGARINLAALRDAAPVLETTAAAAAELDARAQNIDGTYLGLIDDARVQLQDQIDELSGLLHNTSLAAEIAPAMLGADGPRSYFIGFQTNAEARGTGGLLGGFGIVRAADGAVRVDQLSRRDFTGPFQPINLGADFNRTYGHSHPTTRAVNSNVSPHFPHAAQIWQSLWQQESGERVDGAVATDPVALSYVLKVVGPVALPDGEKITADNVVELTESTAYARFADDNSARKQYLENVAAAVVQKMTGTINQPQALLAALGRAVSEGRLAVWSADADEQAVLAATPLGHTVPDDPAPYAEVVVNNLGGNKLDYYLKRSIEYTAGACDGATRNSTVTVRLTNDLPEGEFTDYVAGMFDNPVGAPFGSNLTDLSLVATQGATLDRVTVNGTAAMSFTGREIGHPVYSVQLPVPRGETAEIVFELTEPVVEGAARTPVQPLVDKPELNIDVPACG